VNIGRRASASKKRQCASDRENGNPEYAVTDIAGGMRPDSRENQPSRIGARCERLEHCQSRDVQAHRPRFSVFRFRQIL
jgi:hypothetical protein